MSEAARPEVVLIVDDSLTVRMDLAEAFAAVGVQTVLCSSARETREALARESVALVILDVVLPDADGLELLQEIKRASADDPPHVLLLSTEAEIKDRIKGLKTGADDYVGKPYDAGYVVSRVNDLLRQRRGIPNRRASILVIDDSTTFRNALVDALEQSGYSVVSAENGEEGLRSAAAVRPAAIIVDGVMPGIDGATVIRRVRLDAALRSTPCVLLTASDDGSAELKALDAGADAFVRKDDLEVVLARVSAVLRSAVAEPGDAASLLGPKRILAVDDSPTYLNELSEVLRAEGYDVVQARSGEEALDLLAAQKVDCILLDVVMPGLNGIETCRRVKASPVVSDIPLLMLTSLEDRLAMIDGLSTGADDFISKSGDFEVLKARVRAQLRRKQFEDEHRRMRERLLRSEIEARDAQATKNIAETRAVMIETLEAKNQELEHAYREVRDAQSQLVQSAKMASLGELVAGVAHEINNPLAFAVGHLATARRSLEGVELGLELQSDRQQMWNRAKDRLREMGVGLERIRELVVKLRTFSRLDEGETKRVSVRESVEAVLTILKHRTRDRIVVETRFGEPDCVECYPGLLNQAIMNLVSNATDAIEGEGSIWITSGLDQDQYTIVVADSGSGIPDHVRDRVFEPFFTTKPIGQGTGLGLSITYSIIKKHGGTLELLNRPGGGTEAVVRIPFRSSERPTRVE